MRAKMSTGASGPRQLFEQFVGCDLPGLSQAAFEADAMTEARGILEAVRRDTTVCCSAEFGADLVAGLALAERLAAFVGEA